MTAENGFSHPCLSCGACCAKFRVQFYWREAEPNSPHPVPPELTEELDPFRRCMKGTNAKYQIRCTALEGRIGERVGCGIYENRPSPCRAFQASYSRGVKNKRCDEARGAYGLKPLTLESWRHSVRIQPKKKPRPPESVTKISPEI